MVWLEENGVWLSVVIVTVAVVAIFVASLIQKKKYGSRVSTTKELTMGAVCLATSFALSFFGYEFPQGGTITPAAVLPIMLYCHYSGIGKSVIICVAYSLLQFMQSPYILTPFQVILDYFIPYLSLILVAVVPFSKKKHSALLSEGKKTFSAHWGFFVGAILYIVVRYTSHVLSGAIFFAEYAWEGWGAWPYSMVYNLFAVLDASIAIGAGSALFSNETFNSFMAKSFNAKKNADACTEND